NCVELLATTIRTVVTRHSGPADSEELVDHIQRSVLPAFAQASTCVESNVTGPVSVTLTINPEPGHLTIELDSSWQQSFDLPVTSPKSEGAVTMDATDVPRLGLGVYLMRQLLDEVVYSPQPGQNTWRLVKHLPGVNGSRPVGDTSPQIRLDLPATHKYLNVIGECLPVFLQQAGLGHFSSETAYNVQLAIQEACTNIVDHAYQGISDGRIQVTLSLASEPLGLVVELQDTAPHIFDLFSSPDPAFASPPSGSGLLTGSALLLISTTVVNAGNYLFNLVLGRWLGPAAFADLSLIVTLMLMVTLITAAYQTVTAKFAAAYTATGTGSQLIGLRQWLNRSSWLMGLAMMAIFAGGAPLWMRFFHTASAWPFVILGLGLPIYFAQGVDRGLLQGQTRFKTLALSYQAEMWVRLLVGVGLVSLGWSVNGAVAGITLSFVATWLVARQVMAGLSGQGSLARSERQIIVAFAGPVVAALVGQILINNSDILIVKRFFPAETAGLYAALALIGRIVFFATWSVVTVLFPIVAQKEQKGEPHRHLLGISLGLVIVVSAGIIGVTYAVPDLIVSLLFGEAYLPIASLLWLYGIATMLYALANVVISYRLSIGNGGGSILAVLGGLAQVIVLWFFHATLLQVVLLQVYLMAALFIGLLGWDLWLVAAKKRRRLRE
ncbi:MAG: ATP-binding protein, partial [Anaerolineae bacterium]|nr:ATP-binding protein [Anaerolineae bacterium]